MSCSGIRERREPRPHDASAVVTEVLVSCQGRHPEAGGWRDT